MSFVDSDPAARPDLSLSKKVSSNRMAEVGEERQRPYRADVLDRIFDRCDATDLGVGQAGEGEAAE